MQHPGKNKKEAFLHDTHIPLIDGNRSRCLPSLFLKQNLPAASKKRTAIHKARENLSDPCKLPR